MIPFDMTASKAIPVTPSDSVNLPSGTCWALLIGVTGDVKITDAQGNTNVISGVPAGVLPVKATKVFATGTTASSITALYP